ncbi:hypothetical protein BDZ91DRAFT_767833 [Kalaharituber pfeilii]|nr:hypothetical protein BDZ91DRAFT_767833 [Kalaharituber pfeilii]
MEHFSAIPPRSYWRPWPIKTPYLLLFTCLCVFIAIILQLIKEACHKTGCSTFGSYDVTEVPHGVQFVYNVLPVVLSVAFELLWTLSHHEILRLETYFQLSADRGATEQDSLQLGYSNMFPLLVPVKAFKRRHWVVGLSSCVLLVIAFIVAPLTSGIFDESILQKPLTGLGTRSSAQLGWSKRFTPDFSYPMFKHIVEGTPTPKFTTEEYALQPINITGQVTSKETISAITVLYEAELSCKPAELLDSWWTNDHGFGALFFSREGNINIRYCDKDEVKRPAGSTTAQGTYRNGTKYDCDDFITVETANWTSASFVWQVNSSQNLDGSSFHVWAGPIETISLTSNSTKQRLPANISGIFCTPSYYTQDVNATFTESGSVDHIQRIDLRRPFKDAQGFEHIVNGSYFTVPMETKEYLDSQGKMVGFGRPPVKKMNPQERAFRNLCPGIRITYNFNNSCVTFPSYTLPSYSFLNLTSNDLEKLMDPVFAAEAYGRMFRTMFAFAMSDNLATYGDPNSVQTVELKREVLTRGYSANKTWHLESTSNDIGKQLESNAISTQRRFHLRLVRDRGPTIEMTEAEYIPKSAVALRTQKPLSTANTFTIVSLILIAAFFTARSLNGPTLASMAAVHCMLGPYALLQRGVQSSQKALALDFDKSPPEFQVLSALRSGHFALAALATTIPLSQVLAIALAALFSPYNAEFSIPARFQMDHLQQYNPPTTPREVAFALARNITTGIDGPTWTTEDYYVVPFRPMNSHGALLQYQGPTWAIGLNITCQVVSVGLDTGNFTKTPEERAKLSPDTAEKLNFTLVVGDRRHHRASEWWVNLEKPAGDWAFINRSGDNEVYINAVWLELPANPNPGSLAPPYHLKTITGVGLECIASAKVEELIATVNANEQILYTSGIRPVERKDQQRVFHEHFAGNISYSLGLTFDAAVRPRPSNCPWLCQVSSLIARSHPNIVRHLPTNVTHIPDTNGLPSAFENVIRSFWAVSLRLFMEKGSALDPLDGLGVQIVLQERVQVRVPFFGLAVGILVYMIIVLVALLWKKPHEIMPLPITLAAAYSLLHSSTAKDECQEGKSPKERAKHFVGEYGLGKFQAANGKWLYGVYRRQ